MTPSKLIQALTGGKTGEKDAPVASPDPGLTDPVYVEKLASAVDFISEHLGSEVKVAAPGDMPADAVPSELAAATPAAPVADLGARLRERLHAKIQAKQDAPAEPDRTIENVLGKLLQLRAGAGQSIDTDEAAPEVKEVPDQETDSASAEDEVGEKAASAELTLADVLEGALRANELDEGVAVPPKTASVRGVEGPTARKAAIGALKKGLMAKLGKEA